MTIAVALVGMIGVAMATLSTAAHNSNDYVQNTGDAIQHARVAIERIRRTVQQAHASEEFPGFVVAEVDVSGKTLFTTLAVWKPTGTATNPDGLPTVEELVLFTFDPTDATRLVELTVPGDTSTVPAVAEAEDWENLVASMKSDASAVVVELTSRLHTATLSGDDHGVIQFAAAHRPTIAEWTSYKGGGTDFEDLPWVLGIQGAKSGLRQSRVAFDFQLQPDRRSDSTADTAIPFFGSAAMYYELRP